MTQDGEGNQAPDEEIPGWGKRRTARRRGIKREAARHRVVAQDGYRPPGRELEVLTRLHLLDWSQEDAVVELAPLKDCNATSSRGPTVAERDLHLRSPTPWGGVCTGLFQRGGWPK